jgi:hypothetical protein
MRLIRTAASATRSSSGLTPRRGCHEMIVARYDGKPGASHLRLHQISGVKTWRQDVPAAWVSVAKQSRSISGECRRVVRFIVVPESFDARAAYTINL